MKYKIGQVIKTNDNLYHFYYFLGKNNDAGGFTIDIQLVSEYTLLVITDIFEEL